MHLLLVVMSSWVSFVKILFPAAVLLRLILWLLHILSCLILELLFIISIRLHILTSYIYWFDSSVTKFTFCSWLLRTLASVPPGSWSYFGWSDQQSTYRHCFYSPVICHSLHVCMAHDSFLFKRGPPHVWSVPCVCIHCILVSSSSKHKVTCVGKFCWRILCVTSFICYFNPFSCGSCHCRFGVHAFCITCLRPQEGAVFKQFVLFGSRPHIIVSQQPVSQIKPWDILYDNGQMWVLYESHFLFLWSYTL